MCELIFIICHDYVIENDDIWCMRLWVSRTLCDSDSQSALSHTSRSRGRIPQLSEDIWTYIIKYVQISTTHSIARLATNLLKNLARTAWYLVWNLARVRLHLERNHRKMAAPPDEGSLESRISKSSTVLMKQFHNARVTRYNTERNLSVFIKYRALLLVVALLFFRVRLISAKTWG